MTPMSQSFVRFDKQKPSLAKKILIPRDQIHWVASSGWITTKARQTLNPLYFSPEPTSTQLTLWSNLND